MVSERKKGGSKAALRHAQGKSALPKGG
jgi:hypothetical protein